MMNRREAIQALAALPGVAAAKPVTERTRLLVITLREEQDDAAVPREVLRQARAFLDREGLTDLPVMVLDGCDCLLIDAPEGSVRVESSS